MKKLVCVFLLMFLLGVSVTAGAVEEFNVSEVELNAKAFGMGGAYTGVADDISSIIYNPAGISQSGALGAYGNIGFMVPNLNKIKKLSGLPEYLNDFTAESASDILNTIPEDMSLKSQFFFGGNIKSLGAGLNIYDNVATNKSGDTASMSNRITSEGMVSFGKNLTSPFLNIGALSYGVNLKMLKSKNNSYHLVDTSSPTPELTSISTKGSGFGMDAGLLLKLTDVIQVGMGIENIIASEYTMKGEEKTSTYDVVTEEWSTVTDSDYTGATIKHSPKVRAGASLKLPVINATLAADVDNVFLWDDSEEMTTHLGLEKDLLFNGFSIRAGTFSKADSAPMYTLGLGLNLLTMHVDAAVGFDESLQQTQTFILSGNMTF